MDDQITGAISENEQLRQEVADLTDALESLLRLEVGAHQLQDRLQFSDAGRAILAKANAALRRDA
jgi:hypothetical protein